MTTKELAALLGQTAFYKLGELRMPVIVMDARTVYGKVQLQVMPLAGQGSTWLDKSSMVFGSL